MRSKQILISTGWLCLSWSTVALADEGITAHHWSEVKDVDTLQQRDKGDKGENPKSKIQNLKSIDNSPQLAQTTPNIPPGTIEPTRPTLPPLPTTPPEIPTPPQLSPPPQTPLTPPPNLGVKVQVRRVEVLALSFHQPN